MEPPDGLSLWVGALALGVAVPELVRRWLNRGDKLADAHRVEQERADAEFRAEVRADLKRLLDGQQSNATSVAVLQQAQAQLEGRLEQLEKRQSAQAEAHLAAIERVRSDKRRR